MQTTLLGLAVAIILALVTALVGPLFIDWSQYRASFEAEAARLVGAPVRVHGAIDARLLPVPSLVLRGVEAGPPGGEPRLFARSLRVEFALGPLLRGQWRADELRLDAPAVTVGLDDSGQIRLPPLAIGFDPDQLSVDRLVIENGRLALAEAASGGSLTLDKITFTGELRSLLGPFKGEGSFVSDGEHYGYRVAASRRGEDGGIKLRLAIDPVDRPLALEAEGTLSLTQAHPRFEGNFTLSRPAGLALPDGRTLASVPWRASGRIKATPAAALIEQLDFQYGPEERAIKLAGTADLHFGTKPQFQVLLASRQIDVDRALASAETTSRPPAAMLQALAETLAPVGYPPCPVRLGVSIDAVVFGGASLQSVRGDVRVDHAGLNLDEFEFRAPGATQVRLSGQLTGDGKGLEFVGPASLESADPRALVAWLEGRADATGIGSGSLRARGDVTIGSERIAIDRLRAEFDRRPLEGRLAYAFASGDRPAQLEATLSAAEFDIDRALAFADNALAGATFDRPGQMSLAIDVGKATYAGVELRAAKAKLKFDGGDLLVEQLSIGDLNGARVSAGGHIDTRPASPRGSISMTIDAQRLDGAARLAERFLPQAAETLEGVAARAPATRLNARLDLGPDDAPDADGKTRARLRVDGALGPVRVDVSLAASGDRDAIANARLDLAGHVRSDDGASLARLVGIDRYVAIGKRPARFDIGASGAFAAGFQVEGKFAGSGLDATGSGSLRMAGSKSTGAFDLALSAAEARWPRAESAGAVPVNLRMRVGIAGEHLTFDDVKASVAGSPLTGRLGLTLGRPARVEGRIDAEDLDLAAILGAAIGVPAGSAPTANWSAEPFGSPAFANIEGRVAFSAKRTAFGIGVTGEQISGALILEPTAAILDSIEGGLADGRLAGQLAMRRGSAGVSVEGQMTLNDAELGRVLPSIARTQTSGRLTLKVEARGSGRSPAALIGNLQGGGTVTIEGLQARGLDPLAIGAAVRAGEQGVALDAGRIGDIVRTALDRGRLDVPWAGGGFTIAGGRISMESVTAPAKNANVSAAGNLDLGERTLDLRLTLTGTEHPDVLGGRAPEILVAFKGRLDQVGRSVDVSALVNWLTMRSVEQETTRLEAVEREAKRLQAAEAARRARAQEQENERKQEPKPAPTGNDAPAAVGSVPAPDKVPPLPPPIDIKPAPGASDRRTRRPAAPPARAEQLPPAAAPQFDLR